MVQLQVTGPGPQGHSPQRPCTAMHGDLAQPTGQPQQPYGQQAHNKHGHTAQPCNGLAPGYGHVLADPTLQWAGPVHGIDR